MLHTTLTLLRKQRDNEKNNEFRLEHLEFLLEHLGGMEKYSDNTPIPLTVILDNGLDPIQDTFCCLFATPPENQKEAERIAGLFAADCLEGILWIFKNKYPDDNELSNATDTLKDYANEKVTKEKLMNALGAAQAASRIAFRDSRMDARAIAEVIARVLEYANERGNLAAAAEAALQTVFIAGVQAYTSARSTSTNTADWKAAQEAEKNAERERQIERLRAYLSGAV